jgi:hypothetical protein
MSKIKNFFKKYLKKLIPTKPDSIPVWWQADVSQKEKLTIEDVRFIFAQAEKMLKDSVDTSEVIVNRTNTLITIISGLLIALMGYIITRLNNSSSLDSILFTTIIAIIYLYITVWCCFENTKPKSYLICGSLPKDLFNNSFFDPQIDSDKRIIHFYVSEIENYQYKIETNNSINRIRWGRYQMLLKAILFLPIVLIGVYIFT